MPSDTNGKKKKNGDSAKPRSITDGNLYLGIDLGGTNIKAGVLGDDVELLSRSRKKTKAIEGMDTVISRIVNTADSAIRAAGYKAGDISAVGIGAPGVIDFRKGIVRTAPNLCWNEIPLADMLSEKMKIPVYVDNDVNAGTWAECRLGAAKGFDDMLGVFIGTGIGGGLVMEGKLYHGYHFSAGEIGHTIIHADGVVGRRTLENSASRLSIVNLLKQLILSNRQSVLTDIVEGDLDQIRSKALARAFAADDELTHTVLRRAAQHVAISIANTVTMLSLPAAVVGGGLMEAIGEKWLEWVRESFCEYVFPNQLKCCKILESALGDDANVIGAALLAHENCGKSK